jgi:serine phosphatase RsbU (regulator of sigma subunit)
VSIAAALEPAYDVAGDAFDYAIDVDAAGLAVFDAMGHGLEAARIANLAIAAYRHARRTAGCADVAAAYRAIDTAVAETFGVERFATGQIASLAAHTGELQWINGGHPSPMLLRGDRIVGPLAAEVSLPFGWADGRDPHLNTFAMQPGDRIVFYTDGLYEARSADGELFGETRLVETIERACSERHSPAEAVRRLLLSLVEHRGAVFHDDATAVMLSWSGPPARSAVDL